jgi:peptidoglycan/xylan/chitin deacetylase (PgdA/CDA1 family)
VLLRRLERHGVRLGQRVDRWPGGRRYAVVVTHDTDGPRLQQPEELAKALVKAFVRRSGSEARAFVAGLSSKVLRRPDPYFAFDGWAGAERDLGLRSAFYLYIRSTVRRHARDPLYVIDRHPRWDVLRALADEGWELGVHAGIRAAETADGLRQERQRLMDVVGRPVVGLRHHYWRLNWWSPATTFERQLDAGYEYDCSIAWRDRPGLRAGTCLPYFPPAASGDRPLPLVEIPTCLMDGHLFEYLRLDPDAATDSAKELRQRIASAGGVFNIDWHERTFCDSFSYQGWATVALRLLHDLSTDAWLTTPHELARWWRSRAAGVGLPDIRRW